MEKKKILIVDDEEHVVESIKYMLEAEGYEVYSVSDGASVMDKLREIKVDLILLDLILPGQTGSQVAHQIKSIEKYKHIPIVVIAAKTICQDKDKYVAVKKGAVGYFEKPLDLERMLFYLRDILNGEKTAFSRLGKNIYRRIFANRI